MAVMLGIFGGQKRTANAKAVVTGAGSGIGRVFALELARRGGEVICADIDADRAAETVALIDRLWTGKGHVAQCDVSDRSAVELLANQSQETFGGAPTLVINNAGVGLGHAFLEQQWEDVLRVINTNVTGTLNLPARSLTRLVYKEQP